MYEAQLAVPPTLYLIPWPNTYNTDIFRGSFSFLTARDILLKNSGEIGIFKKKQNKQRNKTIRIAYQIASVTGAFHFGQRATHKCGGWASTRCVSSSDLLHLECAKVAVLMQPYVRTECLTSVRCEAYCIGNGMITCDAIKHCFLIKQGQNS